MLLAMSSLAGMRNSYATPGRRSLREFSGNQLAGVETYLPVLRGAGNHWNEQKTGGYHVVKIPLPICYSRELIRLVLSVAGKAIANRWGVDDLVSCPRNTRYFAGGQLAVFQGGPSRTGRSAHI